MLLENARKRKLRKKCNFEMKKMETEKTLTIELITKEIEKTP